MSKKKQEKRAPRKCPKCGTTENLTVAVKNVPDGRYRIGGRVDWDNNSQAKCEWRVYRQSVGILLMNENTKQLRDRYHGALLGLVAGDAIGTTLEFKSPGTFRPLADMQGGGPFNLQPGQWTDDTTMALCLGEGLVRCQGFDPKDQMERYCRWRQDGYLSCTGRCFDIGLTVTRFSFRSNIKGRQHECIGEFFQPPFHVTSDHRVAGSSPAGCRTSTRS